MKIQIILFILGAILGSFYDGFHHHSGTTYYPNPWIFKMAWWVPLNFGLAILAVANSHVLMDRILKRSSRPLSWGLVVLGLAFFGAVYWMSGFLPTDRLKYLWVYTGAAIIWLLFDRTWQGIVLALLTGIAGSAVEITLIALKLFFYVRPDFMGIPYWLPGLYFAASVTVGNLGRKLISPPRPSLSTGPV